MITISRSAHATKLFLGKEKKPHEKHTLKNSNPEKELGLQFS